MTLHHHRSVPSTYAQCWTLCHRRRPEAPAPSTGAHVCECGARSDTQVCSRCLFLDGDSVRGKTSTESIIISLLRNARYLTREELSEQSGISERKIWDRLNVLLDSGRVVRFEEEFDAPCETWGKGRTRKAGTTRTARWVYKLEGR